MFPGPGNALKLSGRIKTRMVRGCSPLLKGAVKDVTKEGNCSYVLKGKSPRGGNRRLESFGGCPHKCD
jgi:hypothetical protein